MCKGENLGVVDFKGSHPDAINAFTISVFPVYTAKNSGLTPVKSVLLEIDFSTLNK